jgi:hypothetical protein
MKPESVYDRRQSAGRLEAVLLAVSIVGLVTAGLVVFSHGLLPGLSVFLLSVVAYALSRVIDLLTELIGCMGRMEESMKPRPLTPDKNV